MSKVVLVAKVSAVEGKRDELVEGLGRVLDAVEGEQSTEIYAIHLDARDPNVVWFYELYTDKDALAAHREGAATKEFSGLHGLIDGPPDIRVLRPVRAKGLSFR